MRNSNLPPPISADDLQNIALDMRSDYGWRLNDAELDQMVREALPYVTKAIRKKQAKAIKEEQTVEPDAVARKVLDNFYHDRVAVSLLMYGVDSRERDQIVKDYEPWIRGTIYKNCSWLAKSPDREINDIVNDCWVDVLEGLTSFLYLSRLSTWIVKVTIRRRPPDGPRVVPIDNEGTEPPSIPVDPICKLAWEELQQKLCEKIEQSCQKMNRSKQTDLRTRIAIGKDKFIAGMSNVEIAKKYGVKVGTVGSIIKRIKDRFPKELLD